MVNVISGKRYDTETAFNLAFWDNGYNSVDFQACAETLCETRKGALFIYGKGGPMSKYAKPCGNSVGWGERIIPVTREEALLWLEKKMIDDVALAEKLGAEEA